MKKLIFTSIFYLILLTVYAQVPKSFKYQAVVRNSSGEIVANKLVSLKISILEDQDNGTTVYSEEYEKYSTNEYGYITVNVGTGIVVSGNFDNILWGQHTYYMKVELDINGQSNYILMGTSQILSVPYALWAQNVVNNPVQDLSLVDNVLTITNNPNPTPISLSKYIGVDTDQQKLSILSNGNIIQISIERGNTISFIQPSDFVSKASGGTFLGPINATNIVGNGILSLQGNLTLSGTSTIQLISTGPTALTLPTAGTLATQDWVTQGINASKTLSTGYMWVGVSNVATPILVNGVGHILIGNGSSVASYPITGDASIGATGNLTLSPSGVNPATYRRVFVNAKGLVTYGDNPTTLAEYGITDAMPTSHPAFGISAVNINNWNTAFGWGNHSGLYRPISYVPAWSEITSNPFSFTSSSNNQIVKYNSTSGKWENWTPNYLTSYSETDPIFSASVASGINLSNVSNWNTAYGWGNHSGLYRPISYVPAWSEITSNPFSFTSPSNNQIVKYNSTSGKWENWTPTYLTSYSETDPIFSASAASGINLSNISNWNTAYSWGNHTGLYRPITYVPSWSEITGKPSTILGYGISDAMSTSLPNGMIWIGSGSNQASQVTISGDATISNLGSLNLVNSGVTSGTYTKVTVDAKGRVTSGSSPNTLAGYGISDAISTNLPTGTIWIGNSSNIATNLAVSGDGTISSAGVFSLANVGTVGTYKSVTVDAKGRVTAGSNPNTLSGFGINLADGKFYIGNAGSPTEVAMFGDATLSNTGAITVSAIGGKDVILGGTFTTTTAAITLVANSSGSNVVLPASGTLATLSNLTAFTGSTNIATVGTISNGTWQGSVIGNSYINWASPAAIGNGTPNTAAFTTVNISNVLHLNGLSANPSGTDGDIYFNNTDGSIRYYYNGNWYKVTSALAP